MFQGKKGVKLPQQHADFEHMYEELKVLLLISSLM